MNHRKQWVPTNLRQQLSPYGLDFFEYALFLEILISRHSNMVGVFECPKYYLCADLSWNPEETETRLGHLVEIGLVYKDDSKGLVMLDPALGLNPIEDYRTPQQVEMAVKILHHLPQSKIYRPLVKHLVALNKPSIKPVIKKLYSLCGLRDND
jgi:hypothetical protein